MMYCARGIGVIIGSPIGALLISGNGLYPKNYINTAIYDGILLSTSAICLGCLWILTFGDKKPKNWKL